MTIEIKTGKPGDGMKLAKLGFLVRLCSGEWAPAWMVADGFCFQGYSVAPDGVPYVKIKWVRI